jgi:N-acetylneuraminic acid mutarotase
VDDNFCVFGGYSGDGIHNRAARYLADSNEWALLPPMPAPRAATGVAVIGRTVYLIGGWADDGRTPQSTLFSYDFSE